MPVAAVTGEALVVPVRVDLFAVEEHTVTAGPLADFSRLPFHDGRRDVNPGRPYLGESVVDTPFEEASAWLPSGVHLHWTLPETLTRGRHRPGVATGSGADVEFPRVPNRWLVGGPRGWWVVESDYLHPEGVDASAVATSYLMPVEQRVRAPFRYLGRQVPLADWRPDPAARYLDGLTAIGWGHPAFHAYYPNCRSVFGFHHPGPAADTYRVFGWYSRVDDDPVAAYVAARASATDAEVVAGLREEFGWTVLPTEERSPARPARLLCSGAWKAGGSVPLERHLDQIVLGATGAEALAAHLADAHHPDTAEQLPDGNEPADDPARLHEEALESILLASRLDPERPDAVAALHEARHDKEFVAVPGGAVWTIRARGQGLPADAAAAPSSAPGSAPPAAIARLAELNRFQHRRDVLDRRQDVLSAQLHADWCALQQCTYPPRGSRLDHPDVDELRHHIEITGLAALESNFVETDRVTRELAAVAVEIADLLADADTAACEITASDIADWAALAARAAGAHLLDRRSAARLAARPDDETARRAALDELNARVRDARSPAEIPPGGVDPVVRAWVYSRALDDATVAAIERLRRTVLPRPEHAEPAEEFAAAATTRATTLRTVQRHRTILELLLPGVLAVAPKVRHELDLRPGPRFWRPRDPTLLLVGTAVTPSRRHPPRGATVYCVVVPLGADPASALVAAHDDRGGGRSPIAEEIAGVVNLARDADPDADPWHPIMIDWRVALHEEPGGEAAGHGYDPEHVRHRYTLREDRPDLVPLAPEATTGSNRATLVVGRSMLTAHPARELSAALDRPAGTHPFVDAVAVRATSYLATDPPLQAVSLSGLNAALLMTEPVLPVGVDDPLAFPETRAFTERVARAIGRHTCDAPRPLLHFMPIRSGRLRIDGLRILDSFGRVWPDPAADPGLPWTLSSRALPATRLAVGGEDVDVFSLPPRLVPPARLRMRWLAAGSNGDEAHDHPTTGPVCGWLVPNELDRRMMVHSGDGQAVGSVDVPGRWRPAPGRDRIVPPEDLDDPHLRRVVTHLLHRTPEARRQLWETLLAALDAVLPDSHSQHRAPALLMGRPMAVVRASVRLEILGALPVDRSWARLRAAMAGEPRGSAGLEGVRFPLRLGEHGRLDDGLLGFWVDGEGGDRFHTPVGVGDDAHLALTVDGPAVHLTMLLDPRGCVHATTGVLPTKALRIPPEQYGPALDRIGVTFLVAPLLTDPDTLRIARPPVPGHQWSWIERDDAGWREVPATMLGEPRPDATLEAPQELREGWLRLAPIPGEAAPGDAAPGATG